MGNVSQINSYLSLVAKTDCITYCQLTSIDRAWGNKSVNQVQQLVIVTQGCHQVPCVCVTEVNGSVSEQCNLVDYMAPMDRDGLGPTDAILCLYCVLS